MPTIPYVAHIAAQHNIDPATLHPDAYRQHPFFYEAQRAHVLAMARAGRATHHSGDRTGHATAWVYIDGKPYAQASTVEHFVTGDPTDTRRFTYRLVAKPDWHLPRALGGTK